MGDGILAIGSFDRHGARRMAQNITGKKFGFLKAIRLYEVRPPLGAYWEYQCTCGKKTVKRASMVAEAKSPSCGCKTSFVISLAARKDPEKVVCRAAYRMHLFNASKRNLKSSLTEAQYLRIVKQACAYCGGMSTRKYCRIRKIPVNMNSVDRKNNGSTYTVKNSVPCCFVCQSMKGALLEKSFLAKTREIYLRHKRNGKGV